MWPNSTACSTTSRESSSDGARTARGLILLMKISSKARFLPQMQPTFQAWLMLHFIHSDLQDELDGPGCVFLGMRMGPCPMQTD